MLSPLDAPFAVQVDPQVDVGALARTTAHLVGRHDFSAFALASNAHAQPCRRIFAASWKEARPKLAFRVMGDGFLRGMVRSLVGMLIEVGLGKRSEADFAALLAGGARREAGATAPAHGLCLERVFYPPEWA